MAPTEKAFYVSQGVLDGYQEYLRLLGDGSAHTFAQYANGVTVSSYNNIPIFPEPVWEPVLAELYGGPNYNAAVLTLRGNFIWATDKEYGEGEDLKRAIMMWYEDKDLTWYSQQFLKAGTQIALPEHVVFAFPS